MAYVKFKLLTLPSFEKIHILSILFLATQRDPCKFPAPTAVAVLAFPSSYLKVPTKEECQEADQKLMRFCAMFEALCGKEKCTPNMHLHGHLQDCILDYGPVFFILVLFI